MQRELKGGLILRTLSEGHKSDSENLPQFYMHVFKEDGDDDAESFPGWVGDLISDAHPTTTLDDFWVVVDPARDIEANKAEGGNIVSAILLIPQTWRFGDVSLPVGRIELVATHKDYRRRGLVRKQFEAAHARCDSLGHLMQGITGIPEYYRRYGYTMAVELDARMGIPMYAVPQLKAEAKPKFTLRPATDADAEQLHQWEQYRARGSALSHIRTPDLWRYEISGRDPESTFKAHIQVISDAEHHGDVGFVMFSVAWGRAQVWSYIVGPESSYVATFDDVLRGIKSTVDEIYKEKPDDAPRSIAFDTGVDPTVDRMIGLMRGGVVRNNSYAWYIRVPDFVAFFEHVKPVLEKRVADSGANRYTGELKINLYELSHIVMTFDAGKITRIERNDDPQGSADFNIHRDNLMDVIFGYRSVQDVTHWFADVYGNRQGTILMEAMFPKQRSYLVPLA